MFAPKRSKVRETFANQIPGWVLSKIEPDDDWSPCLLTLEGHSDRIRSVVFSPDSTLLASGSNDRSVRVWRIDTGECLQILRGHDRRVSDVDFSPDGTLIVSASEDGTVRIWRISTGVCERFIETHEVIYSVAFSKNGRQIVTCDKNNTSVQVWNSDTGNCLRKHFEKSGEAFAFSPDRDSFAMVCYEQNQTKQMSIKIQDIYTGECLQIFAGHRARTRALSYSQTGGLVALALESGTIQIWSTDTGKLVQILKTGFLHSCLALSADGTLIASDRRVTGMIDVWCVSTGKCVQKLVGHSSHVSSLHFSSNGKIIASALAVDTVRIWHIQTSNDATQIPSKDFTTSYASIAFSVDGTLVASGRSLDRELDIWDVETGNLMQTVRGCSVAHHVALLPDHVLILADHHSQNPKILNSETKQCVQSFDLRKVWGYSQFSTESKCYIASDRRLMVMDKRGPNDLVGVIDLPERAQMFPYRPDPEKMQQSNYTIGYDGCWIQWKDVKVLWLPTELRFEISRQRLNPYSQRTSWSLYDVFGSVVTVVQASGRPIILKFFTPELLALLGVQDSS